MDVPSPDELQRLLKLTGSEDAVVRMLARQWGLSPVVIATTVKGWLQNLPALPPPSRQRSAPGQLAPSSAFAAFPTTIAVSAQRGPEILPIRTPPCTAPVGPNAANLMAQMRAVNSRLNHGTQASYSQRKAAPVTKPPMRVEFEQKFSLLPPTVPEDEPVDMEHMPHPLLLKGDIGRLEQSVGAAASEDAALRAYLERHTIMHGSAGGIMAGNANKRAGGWNYG